MNIAAETFHELTSPTSPEMWVLVGLVIFFAIVWRLGVFKMAGGALDAKAQQIQNDLDEAARIRAEAEAVLAQLKTEREAAEAQAREMIANAQEEAKRLEAQAKIKLEETIARREQMAERRIALAESQAAAEVKAAAADLAAQAAEAVLAQRLAGQKTDPLIDKAIEGLAGKLS
ncbi:MAG: ATP F0F1 synthase subunit B [Caulobacteraceae bacterium]|nr:ATP F0F1 synthase subunit B [Caulobacteraceae bacterium]